jgi:hypothetical protein
MPLPLKTLRYSPAKMLVTSREESISRRRTSAADQDALVMGCLES